MEGLAVVMFMPSWGVLSGEDAILNLVSVVCSSFVVRSNCQYQGDVLCQGQDEDCLLLRT